STHEIRLVSTTKKVEEVTSHSATDRNADVVVSPALGKKSEPFHPIILRAANRHEVDPALVKAIIMVESRYNPLAISKQGAKGLMQLMPRTAQALGVEDSFNPEHNVNGGVKYLKQLLDEFDDNLKFALAAYNAGSSKVRLHRGIPPIKAIQHYVNRVFQYYHYYKNEAVRKTDDV
ncbi:MAG: lytic transglycosylase domain-containing protein, partial [Desulfobacteraceae bacterium]|nr:lytic transglycosylase domain-containing protein [Desulfobacteraceae bacterium]